MKKFFVFCMTFLISLFVYGALDLTTIPDIGSIRVLKNNLDTWESELEAYSVAAQSVASITVTGDITANGNIVGDDATVITNIATIYLDTVEEDGTSGVAIEGLTLNDGTFTDADGTLVIGTIDGVGTVNCDTIEEDGTTGVAIEGMTLNDGTFTDADGTLVIGTIDGVGTVNCDTIEEDGTEGVAIEGMTLNDGAFSDADGTLTVGTVVVDLIDATGAVDMDYGSVDITDHTFTTEDCTVILDGGITVSTGDKVQVGSTQWDNGSDAISTAAIEDDALNVAAVTCDSVTSAGALSGTTLALSGAQTTSDSTVGAVNGTVSVVEYGNNAFHKTVLTVTNTVITLADGDDGEGTKIYDFDEGYICIHEVLVDLVVTNSGNFNASDNDHYNVSLGTVEATDTEADLTSTEANLIAKTDIDTVAGGTTSYDLETVLGTAVSIDGCTTPCDIWLNASIAGTQNSDTNNIGFSGTVIVLWSFLADIP